MARNYENGYLPKIEYWQYKLNKAVEALDTEGVTYAASKLNYFIGRQAEVYGNSNVIAGVDFSESMNLLKSL
jgi:hypothetical protein